MDLKIELQFNDFLTIENLKERLEQLAQTVNGLGGNATIEYRQPLPEYDPNTFGILGETGYRLTAVFTVWGLDDHKLQLFLEEGADVWKRR